LVYATSFEGITTVALGARASPRTEAAQLSLSAARGVRVATVPLRLVRFNPTRRPQYERDLKLDVDGDELLLLPPPDVLLDY
jgi:hypothetical protein